MKAKFEIGDKVKFSPRVPNQTLEEYSRQRTRTIVAVSYSPGHQCSFYELGTNHGTHTSGTDGIFLRSYMLTLVDGERHIIGRPRIHRRRNNTKLPTARSNQRCGDFTLFQHPDYLAPIKMSCPAIV